MVRLQQLVGAAPVAHFECMYTKHKTQKRKVWSDGFLSLYASRRLVLYDEAPLSGTLLESAKLGSDQWDRRDDEFIELPKFLVDVINVTPLQVGGDASAAAPSASPSSAAAAPEPAPHRGPPGGLRGRPASMSSGRFRTPLGRPGQARLAKPSAPAPRGRPHPYAAVATAKSGPPPTAKSGAADSRRFDFERRPTSEWDYKPGAIQRSPDQVLTLLGQL